MTFTPSPQKLKMMRVDFAPDGAVLSFQPMPTESDEWWASVLDNPHAERPAYVEPHLMSGHALKGKTLSVSCDRCFRSSECNGDELLGRYSPELRVAFIAKSEIGCPSSPKRCRFRWGLS